MNHVYLIFLWISPSFEFLDRYQLVNTESPSLPSRTLKILFRLYDSGRRNHIHDTFSPLSITLPPSLLKKCCISSYSLSFFIYFLLYCQLDRLQLDCGFGERIDAAETPSKLAGLTLLLLSLIFSRPCSREKKVLAKATSRSELAFNACSESSLFNWLIKVALDYIPCSKRDTEEKVFRGFFLPRLWLREPWRSSKMNLNVCSLHSKGAFVRVLANSTVAFFFSQRLGYGVYRFRCILNTQRNLLWFSTGWRQSEANSGI